MSNPSVVDLPTLSAADADGIAQAQAVAAAGNLTLNGALVTGGVAILGTEQYEARRVLLTSTGADSGKTFTVYGTDRYGNTQSEAVTGVASGSDQYTDMDYLTVTRIAVSAACAGNIAAGTNEVQSSEWVVDNFPAPYWSLSVAVAILSGTGTFSVQHTYDDPNFAINGQPNAALANFAMVQPSEVPPITWVASAFSAKSANTEGAYTSPIFAHRLLRTAGTGALRMYSTQAGIGSP